MAEKKDKQLYYNLASIMAGTAKPNRKKGRKVDNPIYQWSYYNDVGVICEDKKNIQDYIQSFEGQCDYKKMIKDGEFNYGEERGVYMDCSELGDGYIGVNEYINNLINRVAQEFNSASTVQEQPQGEFQGQPQGYSEVGFNTNSAGSEPIDSGDKGENK